MDARALQRIRRKVEQGERLSEAELFELRQAAQQDAGPTLKLAVAHALSNADEDREALALLARLRRDFPKELQVHLGYARALVGLERYLEAEEVLKHALALNPGDPEALKGLAIIALRRGEHARAGQYVADVLEKDPIDDEARLLRAELEHAELGGAGRTAPERPSVSPLEKAPKAQFIEALMEALEARQVHSVRQGKELWLKLETGRLGRVDLSTLYAAYLDEGESLAQTAGAMAAELAQTSDVPKTRDALLERVWPVLRPPDFNQKATGAAHREGPCGLLIFYVLEDKELVRYVPENVAVSLGVSLSELDESAWGNLGAEVSQPRAVIVDRGEPRLSPEPLGLWALCEADGHDGARILGARQQAALEAKVGQGPYRVSFRRRELTLICREEDERAVAMLQRLSLTDDGIDGSFALRDGRLERCELGAAANPPA